MDPEKLQQIIENGALEKSRITNYKT